jgi:hypothetical protein
MHFKQVSARRQSALLVSKFRHTFLKSKCESNVSWRQDGLSSSSPAWDCLLSAEVFRAYKPDPATYGGVARVFDVPPQRVMLVAAHHDDLAAARACVCSSSALVDDSALRAATRSSIL